MRCIRIFPLLLLLLAPSSIFLSFFLCRLSAAFPRLERRRWQKRRLPGDGRRGGRERSSNGLCCRLHSMPKPLFGGHRRSCSFSLCFLSSSLFFVFNVEGAFVSWCTRHQTKPLLEGQAPLSFPSSCPSLSLLVSPSSLASVTSLAHSNPINLPSLLQSLLIFRFLLHSSSSSIWSSITVRTKTLLT